MQNVTRYHAHSIHDSLPEEILNMYFFFFKIFDEPRVISTNEVSLGTSIATVNHGSPNQLIRNPSDILTSSPVSGESQVTCYSLQAVSTSTSVVDALNRDGRFH